MVELLLNPNENPITEVMSETRACETRLLFKEKCSLVLTARVLFACKLVFEESKAENQSRQFMETSN